MNGWGGDHEMYWNETWQFFKMWFGKKIGVLNLRL